MPITINSLHFSYQNDHPVLEIPHLELPLHRLIILYGRSGSGKSTFLKILAGLLPKYGGHLSGRVTLPNNASPAMMFQDPGTQFALDTPRHEIEFALENLQTPPQQIQSLTERALEKVGITHLADRQFTTLSGGEQQRAMLAVIIAMNRQIILLDEPFASLDHHNRTLILQQLMHLQAEGKTIIIADHDLSAYVKLQPTIVKFNRDLRILSAQQTAQLLHQTTELPTFPVAVPDPGSKAAVTLDHFILQRQNELLIKQEQLIIPQNKITLLTGESGSGKSSFLKALANLIPSQGQITLFDHPQKSFTRRQRGRTVGLMFQNSNDQFLRVTVKEELELSQKNGHHPFFTKEHLQRALQDLGLAALLDRVVYTLSGGQKKKLQLLIMLMMGQPLLLLDEPLSGLDPQSIQQGCQLLQKCQQAFPQTILIISHQFKGIAPLIDYHLQLIDHQLRYQGGLE